MSGPSLDTLYYGDCLDWMGQWDDESVDLIYLDPPFNSKADYNLLYSDEGAGDAQYRAFADTWTWDAAAGERFAMFENAIAHPCHNVITGLYRAIGPSGMLAYLSYMAERLEHMRRLLKPTGSIYLHCDPTASHYLKVVMDAIFGAMSFRNEVIWRIGWVSGFKTQKLGWIRNHDVILYYLKSDEAKKLFNKEYIPYPDGYTRRDGQVPTGKGIPIEDTWNCSDTDRLDSIMIKSFSTEKTGYPTQKPLALLERIVKASSSEGDVVLDPFCGCGTTVEAAKRLNRRYVGIDISAFAIDLIRQRRLKDSSIPAHGIPADMVSARKLATERPFAFESWAVSRLPGFAPNVRQRGDKGIDGRATLAVKPDDHDSKLALAQVKGGKFNLSQFRDFRHVINHLSAALGCYLTLDPIPASARADAKCEGRIHVQGHAYDRLHPWSIYDYFKQRLPIIPVMTDPYTGKPMAQGHLFSGE